MSPTVSVVIPTRNRAATLERTIAPLLADAATTELVVVVDGGHDGSLELLERIARREPRLRPLYVEAGGEMAARDAGARAARGDVVLFVDDDVLASPGLVSGHATRHSDGSRRVVVGYMPVRQFEHRQPAQFATRIYAADYEKHCRRYDESQAAVLTHLWAGNFSLRRADCAAIGLHNPSYTERYHPDREFGLRCRDGGLEGVFDRSLHAVHMYERSLAAFAADARSQGAATVALHSLHPDAVPAPDPRRFERGLPAPARPVVRLAGRRRGYRFASATLRALVRAAGGARAWWLEDTAARLLRRVEQRRGAADAAARGG